MNCFGGAHVVINGDNICQCGRPAPGYDYDMSGIKVQSYPEIISNLGSEIQKYKALCEELANGIEKDGCSYDWCDYYGKEHKYGMCNSHESLTKYRKAIEGK